MEIIYQGHQMLINENLLDKLDAWGGLKEIMLARMRVNSILLTGEANYDNGDLSKQLGHNILKDLTEAEYALQKAWGFEQDVVFHTYHMTLKGCTCPSMDNYEMVGTGTKWVAEDCPYHSK